MDSLSPLVFLLSPASLAGVRGRALLEGRSRAPFVASLTGEGAPIGEVFEFVSSLYFRGKRNYAGRFARPPSGWPGALVITALWGLVPVDRRVDAADLRASSVAPLDPVHASYRLPLLRDTEQLGAALGAEGRAVLLGSLATDRYLGPLLEVLGDRLCVPAAFVGRGDMSRGGLMLRCAAAGQELTYVRASASKRHGPRPPRLPRLLELRPEV